MVQVRIRESGKIEQLCIVRDGIDYAGDFIGNTGAMLAGREFAEYDAEADCYVASQADYDWWSSVLGTHQHIDNVRQALREIEDEAVREDVRRQIDDAVGNTDLDTYSIASFDELARGALAANGYVMIIYSDRSIGFGRVARYHLVDYDWIGSASSDEIHNLTMHDIEALAAVYGVARESLRVDGLGIWAPGNSPDGEVRIALRDEGGEEFEYGGERFTFFPDRHIIQASKGERISYETIESFRCDADAEGGADQLSGWEY